MLEPRRPLPADPLLAECRVAQRVPERRAALLEDLLAVSDEQQAAAAELRSKPRVVDRGHDGLPGARSGDEQVAMVALVAGEDDVLEQRLLEGRSSSSIGLSSVTSVAQELLRAPRELLRVVRDEVAALPVAREDRRHLRDGVRIPDRGDANVPLQPEHLRRVREVRRADVRGRVAALAVEDPRLRVEPRRRSVVRDLDLGAEPLQLVESALLRAVRVRRRQDPQRLACLAMPPQRVGQRPHAAPADERHDDVDRVRRRRPRRGARARQPARRARS